MRESRAALLQIRDATIEEKLRNNSILVIDVGSLTTDLTVLSGTADIPIDGGDQLGGGLLDKAIMRHDLATSPERADLTDLFEREPVYRVRYEYWCRKAKEEFFSTDPKFFEDPDSRPFSKRYRGHRFEPRFDCSVVENLLDDPIQELGGVGWRPRFRQLIESFRKNQVDGHGLQISRIVLTGGGSRMPFVQQLCEEAFPGVRIVKDGDPELCIARGLARRGAVEARTAKFAERMHAYVTGQLPKLVDSRIDQLITNLSGTLAEGGINDVVLIEFGR
jgi:molecular chaperone DnaK (HSP70)